MLLDWLIHLNNMSCPFSLLGLPKTANDVDIIKKWKQLIFLTHPDKSTDSRATEQSKVLNDAKDRAIEKNRTEAKKKQDDKARGEREQQIKENKQREQEENSRIVHATHVRETVNEFMAKHSGVSREVIYGMAETINRYRVSKIKTDQLESKLRTECAFEIKSKHDAIKREAETAAKLKNILQTERELTEKLNNELKINAELTKQLSANQNYPINSDSVQNLNSKKRKVSSENGKINDIAEQTRVLGFIHAHIVACPGNFLTTREVQSKFFTCDESIISKSSFHKILKKCMLSKFSDQPGFGYSRERCNGGRLWGYYGLAFLAPP